MLVLHDQKSECWSNLKPAPQEQRRRPPDGPLVLVGDYDQIVGLGFNPNQGRVENYMDVAWDLFHEVQLLSGPGPAGREMVWLQSKYAVKNQRQQMKIIQGSRAQPTQVPKPAVAGV